MRASVVALVLAAVGVASVAAEGCVYQSEGQGGDAGTIAIWSGDGAIGDDTDGGTSIGTGSGGSSGGSSSGDNGGSSSGTNGSSSGSVGDDGGSSTICPAGSVPCGDGNDGCCPTTEDSGAPDTSVPPVQCPPIDESFEQACAAYYTDQSDPEGECAQCTTLAGESCAMKTGTTCPAPTSTCQQACETQYGCNGAQTCQITQLCECIYTCMSPIAGICCGVEAEGFYSCASSQCGPDCPVARADASVP